MRLNLGNEVFCVGDMLPRGETFEGSSAKWK